MTGLRHPGVTADLIEERDLWSTSSEVNRPSGPVGLRREEIHIASRGRRETRVKFVIDWHCPANRDVVRQILISAAHPCDGLALDFGFKVHNL